MVQSQPDPILKKYPSQKKAGGEAVAIRGLA
jgi:hypothetical protein